MKMVVEFSLLFDYVELFCCLNFLFLYGVLYVEELVECVVKFGYCGIVIIDECLFVGVLCMYVVVKEKGLLFVIGLYFDVMLDEVVFGYDLGFGVFGFVLFV